MTFSMSFPTVLRRTIEQNVFRELYAGLFSFGMMIKINFLKFKGQYWRLMQALVMLTKFVIHLLLVTKIFMSQTSFSLYLHN